MTQLFRCVAFVGSLTFLGLGALETQAGTPETPRASARSSATNFKDMVLAVCIARSQPGEAAADAAGSAQALIEWIQYDAEKSADAIDKLVKQYLTKNYRNPLGDQQGTTAEFNLLKCFDLYHSRELDALGKKLVLPERGRRDKR
jgi:hypothetical protein